MVPTCSGDVKRQMAEFLDAFKAEGGGGAAAASASEAEEAAAVVA